MSSKCAPSVKELRARLMMFSSDVLKRFVSCFSEIVDRILQDVLPTYLCTYLHIYLHIYLHTYSLICLVFVLNYTFLLAFLF